ncbi:TetR/AcrR family transcriptional regulator [Myroides guanonis]|uniref:Transcriptional regulator, TetR family n=1 Tax=Myroides guanonis TaxID=1150112 RepID=A0A1I3Q786_9FLAO|nr:TetR/AcrR family transcriptional regulator [Myroides guanonis]SFJ29550.1 transcriptional regulator, TetR family [Myroides guanonis]
MEETILNKASELFLAQGFKSVTMDDIATELGISKKTIYQYYASKLELVEKTMLFINSKILHELTCQMSNDLDSITEMLEAHRKIDEVLTINNSASLHQLKKYYPKIAQKVRSLHLPQYLQLIEGNIKKGIEQGLFRSDIDIEFSSRFFFASNIALEDTAFFPEKDFDLIQIHKLHLEYYLRSIATEKGHQKIEELKKDRIKNSN